jgi:ribosome-binding protein aMBF1 (putative translation factor)
MNPTVILRAPPELKKQIEQARLAKKLSRAELAQKLTVTEKVITEYETGKTIPTNAFIARIEKELQVKLPRAKKVEI